MASNGTPNKERHFLTRTAASAHLGEIQAQAGNHTHPYPPISQKTEMSVYGGVGSRVTREPTRKEGHRRCVLGADDEPTAPDFTSGAGGHQQPAGQTLKTLLIREPFGMPHRSRAGCSSR